MVKKAQAEQAVVEPEETIPQGVEPTQPEDWQAEDLPQEQEDQIPQAQAPQVINKSITNVIDVERGGVAWADIYGMTHDEDNQVHLVKISLTNRADDAEAALRGLMKALKIAKDEFRMYPYQPTAPQVPAVPKSLQNAAAPAQVNPPAPAPQAGPALPPPPPPSIPQSQVPAVPPQPQYVPYPPQPQAPAPAAPSLPANPNAATSGVMDIVKINVTPRGDGKVTVDLFGMGHKYRDLFMVGTPEQMVQRLGAKGFTVAHFSGAATYPVNLKVSWANSDKLNSNGVPYKNVTAIA